MTRDKAERRTDRINEAMEKLVGELMDRIEELESERDTLKQEVAELNERLEQIEAAA